MRSKTITFFALVLLVFSSSNAQVAVSATAKAGGVCSKAKNTTSIKGVKYKCTKSGNKLTWQMSQLKIAAPAVPAASEKPSATATPTTTPAATQPEGTGKLIAALTTPEYLPKPPEGGNDEYRCFLLDPKISEESFLDSVTITPGNLKVSHHGILYRLSKASVAATQKLDQESTEPGWPCFGDVGLPGTSAFAGAAASSWVAFWAPGGNFKSYPTGTGMKFSAGDQLILQTHFMVMSGHAGHGDQSDKSNLATTKIEISKATGKVAELKTMLIAAPIEVACGSKESGPLCNRAAALSDLTKRTSEKAALQELGLLSICGKDPRNPVATPISECTQKITSNRKIYGTTPHMHQLGTKISIWHTSGSTTVKTNLSDRSQWNFDNQTTDWLATPIDAKSGDTISISCTFDVGLRSLLPMYMNLSPNYIVWGEGTRDEMCLGIINYTE
jgi:Copper type II ascorbate-dependent monooxygenase, C-terminal domain